MNGFGVARSWLYVPGHRPDLVAKALAGDAEAVVVDLEDAVPVGAKQAARETLGILRSAKPVWVRMNPPGDAVGRLDLEALAGLSVDGVRVPKATDPAVVRDVAQALETPLHLLLESALGVERAFELATAHELVVGLSLGEADLAADLRVRDRTALEWARQRVVVASRAAGLASPVAPVWTDVADLTGLAADSAAARNRGFHGRSVIHPSQVPVVHRAFTPSPDELAHARALLASLEDSTETAFLDADGRFVDPAVVAGARALLAQNQET
ncbi:HpcH/HpaI aldolase/citrate lyase family protein [Actinomycetospora soli]|uniref:HpcH/HpaI aldolase/citrate lyase family protein n=1 Tax=Actinomycetospora soli TaxID=2893887 RepID=UPI001E3775FF|nr:CoA ester lyase [Actinomycetospora soli]MCD2186542.1 CoA ester lyase [Actinomycetospora soli]